MTKKKKEKLEENMQDDRNAEDEKPESRWNEEQHGDNQEQGNRR